MQPDFQTGRHRDRERRIAAAQVANLFQARASARFIPVALLVIVTAVFWQATPAWLSISPLLAPIFSCASTQQATMNRSRRFLCCVKMLP